MRYLALLPLIVILAACQGVRTYTALDVQQVNQGWHELHPTYEAFKQAYLKGDASAVNATFRRAERQCRLPDKIDKRDSIDASVNLFWASVALDDICNTIESTYATWRLDHGLPYDKVVTPARKGYEFIGQDAENLLVPKMLAHPAAYH